jgi:TRAP-type C4-dicarboxylate transport system permease small subunit
MIKDIVELLVKNWGYDTAIQIKHLTSYTACFFAGVLMMIFFNAYLWDVVRRDDDMDEIAMVRLTNKDGKERIFVHTDGFAQSVHNQMIILFWKLGIYKKRKINWMQARAADITMKLFIVVTALLILLSILLSMTIVASPDGEPDELKVEIKEPLDPEKEKPDDTE